MGVISYMGLSLKNLINFIKNLFKRKKKPIIYKKYGTLVYKYKRNYGLSSKTERKSIRKHNKLVHIFTKRNRRNPNRHEIGGLIITASHLTIKYKRGRSGHWGRQKVREYLFNLHGIDYKKIPSK
jgi:hypothetical protein